jgi:hypothetical protein
MLTDLLPILIRDIDTLTREIELYPTDEAVWATVPGLPNSGGTLILHLVGNLRHFIGATLGHTGFVRDRDAEFSARGHSRAELRASVSDARADVVSTLSGLPASVLDTMFPLQLAGFSFGTPRMLLHVATHLSYHLGQIDYHRRAVTGDKASAGAMALAPIAMPPGSVG